MFFFFKGAGRYFKTVLINFLLYMLFSVTSAALNISNYLENFFPNWYEQELSLTPESFAVVFAGILTVLIQIIIYMIFVHYPLTAYALNENISVGKGVFAMMGFSFKHFGKLFKLALSFAGWFALCFFVVPVLYVLPYFSVSALLSAKWLFALEPVGGAV